MNYAKLKDEIVNDPLGRSHAGKDDATVAADLNSPGRDQDLEAISGEQILAALDEADIASVKGSADFWGLVGMQSIPLRSRAVRSLLADIFPAGSTTRANLVALQTENVSRARELGLGTVWGWHVAKARRA